MVLVKQMGLERDEGLRLLVLKTSRNLVHSLASHLEGRRLPGRKRVMAGLQMEDSLGATFRQAWAI